MEAVLEIKDLTFKRKRKVICSHLSLQIPEGCIYALAGGAGTGKTTLQKILSGQLAYKSGEIMIYGRKDTFAHHNPVGSNLIDLDEHLSVISYLVNICMLAHLKHPKDEAMNIITLMQMENIAKTKISRLADSNRHLLRIAAALAGSFPLVLIDEPFAGLSDEDTHRLQNVFETLRTKKNMSFLITSHTLKGLAYFSDMIGILKDGQLACEIKRDVLKEQLTKEIHVRVNDVRKAQEILGYGSVDGDWLILDHGDSATLNQVLMENDLHVYEIKIVHEDLTHYFKRFLGGEQ